MKRRARQHVNPLKMTSLVSVGAIALPPAGEVEVELGCGDAHFILQLAQRHPDIHYVGVDIRDEFLQDARDSLARLGLPNVQLVTRNLIVDAEHLFVPARVRRFYVNFPDPWFKWRHHNRRWFTTHSLACLVEMLVADGEVLYQTDVWDLAIEALGLLEAHPHLRNWAGAWTFLRENPVGVESSRDEGCRAEGRPVWRMLFRKES